MNGGRYFSKSLLSGIIAFGAMGSMAIDAQAQNNPQKNVQIVLDASGSMNGKLRDKTRKMAAAKQAVAQFVGKLPADIILSLRAYGHQSHRSKHNCKDTALLVPFGNVSQISSNVVSSANALDAQGYTPISYVLGLAADDLKPLNGDKTIVLVSDGKETCEGDPCLLAKKLADANADLTIHTVGLGVDFQTKTQLQCIANVGRGQYRDANSTDELASSMEEATIAELKDPETEEITIKIAKPKFGKLEVVNGTYHNIYDAETGKNVGVANKSNKHLVKLMPGIYNVEFGENLLWKSVQVVGEETTSISAGVLKINKSQYHHIFDPETDQKYLTYGSSDKQIALPPGTYEVGFDKARWGNVVIREGETTLLDPAILKIANHQYHHLRDIETNKGLMTYGSSTKYLAVPPGSYNVTFDKINWKVDLDAGKETILNPAILKIANHQYHHLTNKETGKGLMTYGSSTKYLAVPPGQYNITFDKLVWAVNLEEGKETLLKPAVLKIANHQYHHIHKAGEKRGSMTYGSSTKFLAMPPGEYEVGFHKSRWKIKMEEGKALTLNPGGFKVTPKGYYRFYFAETGKTAGALSSSDKQAMLAPGKYYVEIADQKVPLNITEGKIININLE